MEIRNMPRDGGAYIEKLAELADLTSAEFARAAGEAPRAGMLQRRGAHQRHPLPRAQCGEGTGERRRPADRGGLGMDRERQGPETFFVMVYDAPRSAKGSTSPGTGTPSRACSRPGRTLSIYVAELSCAGKGGRGTGLRDRERLRERGSFGQRSRERSPVPLHSRIIEMKGRPAPPKWWNSWGGRRRRPQRCISAPARYPNTPLPGEYYREGRKTSMACWPGPRVPYTRAGSMVKPMMQNGGPGTIWEGDARPSQPRYSFDNSR